MQSMGDPFSQMQGLPRPFSGLVYGGKCIINYVNGLVQMVNGHQEANSAKFASQQSQIDGHEITIANSEAALRVEISSLRNQLADSNAAREAEKQESDAKYHQMQEQLQQLAKINADLVEQVTLLAVRVNMPKGGSIDPSFFGGSSTVDIADLEEIN